MKVPRKVRLELGGKVREGIKVHVDLSDFNDLGMFSLSLVFS